MGANGPNDLAQIEAATRALFDLPVAVAVTDPRLTHDGLFDAERALVADARPQRRQEFAAGRAAAHRAMSTLGIARAPVLRAADRAPIWPAGVTGSISHSRTACVAVLGRCAAVGAIGLDIEDDHPLEPDLVPLICNRAERALIAATPARDLGTLIFSAKESAYKAQYPVTGALFGFECLEIAVDPGKGCFTARFREAIGCFAVGDSLKGRFAKAGGHVVTAVTIEPIARGTA